MNLQTLHAAVFLFVSSVSAQTLYVDATNGNDAWTGSLPDAQGSDGPWRSLAKVNAASLQPGDVVLLKCGASWREPLVIPASGAAGNPITFGRYGANCDASNKPIISGAGSLSGWSAYSGNIYTTQNTLAAAQQNRVVNGHFDLNLASWSFYPSANDTYPSALVRLEGCTAQSGACAKFTGSTGAISVAISNRFSVAQGKSYRVKFWLKAELANQNVRSIVRRNGRLINGVANYDAVGFNQAIAADVSGQTYDYTFTATSTEEKTARIDFQVDAGQSIYLDNVEVTQITPEIANIKQVFVDGAYVKLAQHPNPRSSDPTDTYLAIAQDQPNSVCPGTGGTGTASLITGSDLILSTSQEQDLVGAGVHIRTNNWIVDDRTIAAYDGANKTLTLSSPSTYNLCQGWGYYLDGKRWMLDSAGEWHYDSANQQLSIWLPDGGVPGARVEAGYQELGIDARSRAHVVIDGLRVEKAMTGIDLSGSVGVEVRDCDIQDSGEAGIVAVGASSASIINCSVVNSVRNGIVTGTAADITIRGNSVSNTGVVGSPKKSVAAIEAGVSNGALIENNHVLDSGYIGINIGTNAVISGNHVENSCLVLDDCGAIYTWSGSRNGAALNSSINDNVVRNALGNINGRPAGRPSSAQGIYLDELTNAVTVQGNTVLNTDWGIQIHNGYDNVLAQNTVYGARQWPVRISEDTLASPFTVRNNRVESNLLFPTKAGASYRLSGSYDNNDFCTYDLNRYSSLYGNLLVDETYKPGGATINSKYTLAQWQQTRNQDLNSTSFDPFGVAGKRIVSNVGGELVSNSTFDSGVMQWGAYQGSNAWISTCVDGGCLRFTRDATAGSGGLANTYPFSVQAGKSYLVRFDLKGGLEGQAVTALLRGAGNPNYNAVGLNQPLQIGAEWQSYAYLITATETRAYDGSLTSGARLDFHVSANEAIYLDNVIVQEVAVEINNSAADDSAILINTNAAPEAMACPDAATNPTKCSQYVRFADGSAVQWPLDVPAMRSEIVVWSQNPLRDSDRDDVADSNDICPDPLPSTATVDEQGCTFAQRHSVNLSVALTDSSDPVLTEAAFSYTATVTNKGPAGANGVVASLTLPAGASGTASPSLGNCTGTGIITCNLGPLPNGGSATIQVTATAFPEGVFDPTTTLTEVLTASVAVAANEPDPYPADNTGSATTTVTLACKGQPVTIRGTSGGDGKRASKFLGTSGADVMHGLSGDDWIDGKGGADRICGGAGNDKLYGSGGNDALYGGAGNDNLYGSVGTDTCDGGAGGDTANSCETKISIP